MLDTVFRLQDVTVQFPSVRALHKITLEVGNGERIAVIGPSGSGKTTLFRTLNAVVRPTSGTVSVFGDDLARAGPDRLRKIRSNLAMIPQDLALVPNIRVSQNVVMGRFGKRGFFQSLRDFLVPSRSDTETVFNLLSRVGIEDKIFARTDTLSGGQQQRVAIARSLFGSPGCILADEPVSSVDPARARDTVDLLNQLAQQDGLTLLMSLHNVDLAREFFPRVVALRDGQIEFDGAPGDLAPSQIEQLFELQSGTASGRGRP